MRYAAQIRAARALLGLRQDQLAKLAGIGLATLQRIEQAEGQVKGNYSTIMKIQSALEAEGIEFIENGQGKFGVQLGVRTSAGKHNRQQLK